MNVSADSCSPTADNAFGPAVPAHCRDDFDFTLAFEQYFFTIVPSALLILAVPWRLWGVLRLQPRIAGLPLRFIKLTTTIVLSCVQLSILALWASNPELPAHIPSVAASGVAFAGCIFLALLSLFEHSRSIRPSFLLNGYLFLTVILDAATLRTLWLLPSISGAIPVLYSVSFGLKLIVLVLEALDKRAYSTIKAQSRSPEEWSGLYSQGLLWWLNGIMYRGASHLLSPTDLYPIVKELSSAYLHLRFTTMRWTLFKLFKSSLLLPIIPRLVQIAFTLGQPFLLRRLLSFLVERPDEQDVRVGYGLIGAYGFVYFGMAVSTTFYWHRHYRFLFAVRGTLIGAIYSKAMRLGSSQEDGAALVTMMSTDVERIVRGLYDLHEIWAQAVQVALTTWLIQRTLGLAWIGPLVVSAVAAATTLYSTRYTTLYQIKWITGTQARLSFSRAALGAIKSIKIHGLGPRVADLLQQTRVHELREARPFRHMIVWSSSLANVPMLISPVITYIIVAVRSARNGDDLDATRIFTTLSLLMLLAEPLFSLFVGFVDFMSGLACFTKIESYLDAEELRDHRYLSDDDASSMASSDMDSSVFAASPLNFLRSMSSKSIITIRNGCFGWALDEDPVLNNVDMVVAQSQGIGLTGPVACGKSTLLKALLGETPLTEGEVTVAEHRISHCEQSPWLINASVQRNIVMYERWDGKLYREVIHACDLEEDINTLPQNDKTVIGSKGFSLSGGQKQRLALARTLYANRRLALFDDCLSQLDVSTQARVFTRVFGRNGLLRKRQTTFLLVTYMSRFLEQMDAVFQLNEDGHVAGLSSYGEVSLALTRQYHHPMLSKLLPFTIKTGPSSPRLAASEYSPELADERADRRIPNEEMDRIRQVGDASVYRYYFASLTWRVGIVFLCVQVVYAFLTAFPVVWLKWWADSINPEDSAFYVATYGALQVGALITSGLVTCWTFHVIAVRTGLSLHEILARTVMSAPYAFLSKEDSGELLNRFGQDVQLLDMNLPLALQVSVSNFFICLAQLGLIASGSAWILISYPFLFAVFYFVQNYYLKASRQMRYLDLEEKAPLYTHFTESIDGLATIRAFKWTEASEKKNLELIDRSQKPFYLIYIMQRWLVLVLELVIGGLAVLVVGVTVALRDSISPGFTGVSLTQIISFSSMVKLMILFWAQMETALGSVARIRSFEKDTPSEGASLDTPKSDGEWPAHGRIKIENVTARYSESDLRPALDGISMDIFPGQKIGVCGRTGSGKSSLILALLRMIDAAEGRIYIDEIDLKTVPRETVRASIISVAEEPFMVNGTVKDNLSLYSDISSDEAQIALTKVKLWTAVQSAGGLDADIAQTTFSQGQKQLFNLARALLKPGGHILLLDEFTSSIDLETDTHIQQLVHAEFWDHTIIAVAHRLDTILDYDRVAVMEDGHLVEFGNPRSLLESPSKFQDLYNSSTTTAV
ncbi:P-loop containing nucleoside triphosphate hydrolase protein [Elsinoe ampelina]|uniref:P-loop containing nucleoside triphosphate hydrolase protein n=1 Tax=Elsinoe ampelina TaxID=302913 RepID=A0A6A6FZW5_9PEZI|nr:P-loop containing nucleoside triphosphate hydrolase protein [Elsinoe ampelina]